jgi:uncharacterized protein (DUF488 family)
MNALYTIGHSTHDWEHFVHLLQLHKIEVLGDVRSMPYSRFTPQYNRESLTGGLARYGIKYVFLGQELGARRSEPECFVNGKVIYDLVAKTPAFQKGLDRLRTGIAKYRVAIMCAEKDPLECHRTILVAHHAKAFAEVVHILADGGLETHAQAEARLMTEYHLGEDDLFVPELQRIENAYAKRASDIAYQEIAGEAKV